MRLEIKATLNCHQIQCCTANTGKKMNKYCLFRVAEKLWSVQCSLLYIEQCMYIIHALINLCQPTFKIKRFGKNFNTKLDNLAPKYIKCNMP